MHLRKEREGHNSDLVVNLIGVMNVPLRVAFSDETTRHHYYLQLRDNVVRHGGGVESLHPHHPLHDPSIVTPLLALAGLALQADLGDYSEERHRPHAGSVGYCKSTDYLPPHVN